MTVTTSIADSPDWNLAQRIFFRFFCVYFILYIFPFPASFIPGLGYFIPFYMDLTEAITLWFGTTVFGVTDTIDSASNGSGDRLFNYISMFTNLIIALIATAIWSAIDFKRKSYHKVLTLLTIYIRYYLAMNLLSYGFSKIFTNQFSELGLSDYLKTYGESSPMGLVWNLMEYSDMYTIFSGLAEVVPGLLLLFRRTTTFGAVLAAGVMLNVFMLNMSFDVPVKLFSGHLLLMSIFLVTLDWHRIANLFILNKPVAKKQISNYFSLRKWHITQVVLKILIVTFFIGFNAYNSYSMQSQWGKLAPKPALYGIYDVTSFAINNESITPSIKDSVYWKRFVVDKYRQLIFTVNDNVEYRKIEVDTVAKTLALTSYEDNTDIYQFDYMLNDSIMILNGTHLNDTLDIELKKRDLKTFLLNNRGFNWVNDYPFNR